MFKSRKKRNQEVLEKYGKVKTSFFDFERISMFFLRSDKSDAFQVIADSTCKDLDFEEFFMFADRTSSAVGQQYLYSILRTIPKDQSTDFETIIKHFNENPRIKEAAILELNKLKSHGAYFIQQLIFGEHLQKPKWFWVVPLLSNLSIIATILVFVYPALIIGLIPIFTVNFFIHIWNKNNVFSYSNSIPQLLLLQQVSANLISSNAILENVEATKESEKVIRKISSSAIFFKLESKLSSEFGQIAEYVLDLLKGVYLFEPLVLFRLLRQLEQHKTDIKNLFIAVSRVDVALSISSFRASLPFYAIPTFSSQTKSLTVKNVYHPLMVDPVSNSLDIDDGKSIIISGSNMSGKTTFIRTIGINALLAQTINTTCSESFALPRVQVYTAIRISDDLLDDTSYYYAEVKRIKELLEASEMGNQNLFLLDELFKGTNTVERIASGKAVLSYLNQKDNLVLASTHDLELTDFLAHSYSFYHFADDVKNDVLTFDYKLKKGKLTHTNAIRILETNDFPSTVTDEAKAIAAELIEKKSANSKKR